MFISLVTIGGREGVGEVMVAIDQIATAKALFGTFDPRCRVTLKSGETFDVVGTLKSIDARIKRAYGDSSNISAQQE